MHDEERLTPAQRELADALGKLKPAPSALDRGAVMFAAGRASGRRRVRLWQAAAVMLAACTLASLTVRPGPATVVEVRTVTVSPDPPAEIPVVTPAEPVPAAVDLPPTATGLFRPIEGSYLALRNDVLARGLDALPTSPALAGAEPLTLRSLLGDPKPQRRPGLWNLLNLKRTGDEL